MAATGKSGRILSPIRTYSHSRSRRVALYVTAGFCLVGLLLATLLAAESVARLSEGMPLRQLALPVSAGVEISSAGRRDGKEYVTGLVPAPGVKREWFFADPPELAGRTQPDPRLLAIRDRIASTGMAEFDMYKRWNSRFVAEESCGYFRDFPGFVFTFDSPEPTGHPRYRYFRDTVTPSGLVTNRFGWRGPQIELNKPDRTVRVVFIGASTTVNAHSYPFSYPELIGHWLNLWAQSRGLMVRFEVINAGREGIASDDIAAIVRQEVLPVEPDLVVYYEGANEFDIKGIIGASGVSFRLAALKGRLSRSSWLARMKRYSVLARRADSLVGLLDHPGGTEAPKPEYHSAWPAGVDEFNPLLGGTDLPAGPGRILVNLDLIRRDLQGVSAELILTSFVWLVEDGMVLEPVKHQSIHRYLNLGLYPFRYRDVRRAADFQNRVFAKYAAVHGLDFIDVDKLYPRDPDLFTDPIHQTYAGVRLRAWIVLQQLVPILQRRIESGQLPRPDQVWVGQHPAFTTPETTVDVHC